MHERKVDSAKRFAGEIIIPERRRRHGRGVIPARAIPWGRIQTPSAVLDAFDGLNPAIVEATFRGEVTLRNQRRRKPDGTRYRPTPPPLLELTEHQRLAERADLEAEFAARMKVERAIAAGEMVHAGRHYRVLVTPTGSIRTIPDKGAVLKWADSSHLAEAIACGAF